MEFEESKLFEKQCRNFYKNRFGNIYEDLDNLKEEVFPKIAFRKIANWNKKLGEIELDKGTSISVWVVRHANSNTDEGKRSGYRIFYCKLHQESGAFLLGIYYKADIEGNDYEKMAEELIQYSKRAILKNRKSRN